KSGGQSQPGRWSQIVLIINLRPFEHRACRPDKPVLIRTVNLALVIVSNNQFVVPPLSRFPIDMRPNQPALSEEMIDRPGIKDRIRQTDVADRIREQTADAQLLVRRPADIRDRGRVAVVVVRPRILSVETTRTN